MESIEDYKKWWTDAKDIITNLMEEAETTAIENHTKITSIKEIRKNIADQMAVQKKLDQVNQEKEDVNVIFHKSETKADGYRMASISVSGLIAEVPSNPYDKDVNHMHIRNEDKNKFYGLIQQVHNNGFNEGFKIGSKSGYGQGWEEMKAAVNKLIS